MFSTLNAFRVVSAVRGCVILAAVVFINLLSPHAAIAKIYYVDFEKGSDAHSGRSRDKAWKHAPGDRRATKQAAFINLSPGDVVQFKGGVRYLGSIYVRSSGSPQAPIVYRGTGWGAGRAIIDGTDRFDGPWHACTSAADCGGNANWRRISYVTLKKPLHPFQPMFVGKRMMQLSQFPVLDDPFWYDDVSKYRHVSRNTPGVRLTPSSLRDPGFFRQREAGAWTGALFSVWVKPNVAALSFIKGYEPDTNTIRFETIRNALYTNREIRYSLLNHVRLIARDYDYAVSNAERRLYVMLPAGAKNAPLYIGARHIGFKVDGYSHVVIKGFRITGLWGGDRRGEGSALAVSIGRHRTRDVRVSDLEIWDLRSHRRGAAVEVDNADGFVFENSRVHDIAMKRGIEIHKSQNVRIRNNRFRKIGSTAVGVIYVRDSVFENNVISDVHGVHANGMSFYLDNRNLAIVGNLVWDAPRALTMHGDSKADYDRQDILIMNNVFLGGTYSWGDRLTGIFILNNIFLSPNKNPSLSFNRTDTDIVLKNNIIAAACLPVKKGSGGKRIALGTWAISNNLYTDLCWVQDHRYGWSLQANERVVGSLGRRDAQEPADLLEALRRAEPVWRGRGVDASAYLERFKTLRPELSAPPAWPIGPLHSLGHLSDQIRSARKRPD